MAGGIARLLAFGSVVRASFIILGELQDRLLTVKYTDIDYSVFSDAARYVVQGQSPFLRSTYRYSPLLAYLLVPNTVVHHAWGKVGIQVMVCFHSWSTSSLNDVRPIGSQQSICHTEMQSTCILIPAVDHTIFVPSFHTGSICSW